MKPACSILLSSILPAVLTIHSPAQSWEDLGNGSGSPPGIFQLENFDSAVSGENRVESFPRILGDQRFRPSLVFLSVDEEPFVPEHTAYNVVFSGGSWVFPAGSEDGKVFPEVLAAPGFSPAVASNSELFSASVPGTPPLGLAVDAYASFYDSPAGWAGRDGSLESGGLTGAATFSEFTYETGVGVSIQGASAVAYSKGSSSRRGIFVQEWTSASGWRGLENSDTTPIAPSSVESMTNLHPAVCYVNGGPVVAWTERISTVERVKLLHFDTGAGEWIELGESFSTGLGMGRRPQLAATRQQGTFYLTFENLQNGGISVSRWDNVQEAFEDLGNPLEPWGLEEVAALDDRRTTDPEPHAASLAMSLDTFDRPVVAVRAESPAESGKFHLFVSHLQDSGEWVAVGDSESELGASGIDYAPDSTSAPLGHYAPSLYVPPDNKPILAWMFEESPEEARVILLKQFTESISQAGPPDPQALSILLANLQALIDPDPLLKFYIDSNQDGLLDAADTIDFLPDPFGSSK